MPGRFKKRGERAREARVRPPFVDGLRGENIPPPPSLPSTTPPAAPARARTPPPPPGEVLRAQRASAAPSWVTALKDNSEEHSAGAAAAVAERTPVACGGVGGRLLSVADFYCGPWRGWVH